MEKTRVKSFSMTASLVVFLVCCLSCEVCSAREGISKMQTTEDSADPLWLWGGYAPWTFPRPGLPPFWLPRLPPFPFPRHWPPFHGFPRLAPPPKPAPKPSSSPASPANSTNTTPSQGTSTPPRSKSAPASTTPKPTN